MSGAANNGLDPERFAALWAGCDAGNSNEAEAVNKFRALRRMVVADNLRIVDLMGRADVMQALDLQLLPVREESPQLKEAFGKIAELADALAREREITAELREQLSAALIAESPARRKAARVSPQPMAQAADASGPVMTFLEGLAGFVGITLMLVGVWHIAAAVVKWVGSFF